MQVIRPIVSQQQDSPEKDQWGNNTTNESVQVVGTKNCTVKPKSDNGHLDDRTFGQKDDFNIGANHEQEGDIAVPSDGNQGTFHNTGQLHGRIKRNQSKEIGRGGGKLLTDSSQDMLPEDRSAKPPSLMLGLQVGGLKRNNNKNIWNNNKNIPVGSTDMGQQRYSVPWLLQRRDSKDTQEINFDFPEKLNIRLHSPSSQKRRYPFGTDPIYPSRCDSGIDKDEETPAWMEETENLDMDFNFKVLGKDDKLHWEKFGKVKDVDDIKVFTSADWERSKTKKQDNSELHRITENENQFTANPLTQNDIMQAFCEISRGENRDNIDDIFNPDILFAVQPRSQLTKRVLSKRSLQKQIEHDVDLRAPANTMPEDPAQSKQMSPEKEDFLHKLMKGKGQSAGQLKSKSGTGKTSKQAQHKAMIWASDIENEFVRKRVVTAKTQNQVPISSYNVLEMRHGPNTSTNKPISQSQQRQPTPQRFSNSSLKENEKLKLSQMLHEKLRKYSVAPSQLAYASRSASKAVKVKLENLGYLLVPSPYRMNTSLTKNEKVILSFQHEIRKQYQIAIYRANEKATRYRVYHKRKGNA